MLTAKNRPHKCQNGPKTVKSRYRGSLDAQTAEMGVRNYDIYDKRENGWKTTNFANCRVKTGRADVRRAREGPKVPFACICVHLRSFFGVRGPSEGSKCRSGPQMDANGRKWGIGGAKDGNFQQENRKGARKQEGKGRKLRNSRKTRKIGRKMRKPAAAR